MYSLAILSQVVWDIHMYLMDYSWPGYEAVFKELAAATEPMGLPEAHASALVKHNAMMDEWYKQLKEKRKVSA